jgi:hypothetical protein
MLTADKASLANLLLEAGIEPVEFEERVFPGERWLIGFVPHDMLLAAQAMAGSLERKLNGDAAAESSTVVVFRGAPTIEPVAPDEQRRGRLSGNDVDQLIQLLEARSRTSDALPSLKYMEDPRASLGAIGASRHQLVYGRRGVGKTALLLEAKRVAEREGHATVWINAHVVRRLDVASAVATLAELILQAVVTQGGKSEGAQFETLRSLQSEFQKARARGIEPLAMLDVLLPKLNAAFRAVLREDLVRLYVYIDDFYLLAVEDQPTFLDYVAGILRDCNGWLKIASIERLTRPYEPSTRTGLEIPHDAIKIDLDVTLENPAATQRFLEAVLVSYTTAAGVRSLWSIAKPEALARLVLASGGVPRDYLNLFAASLGVARRTRERAMEVGREDVAIAAGLSANGKKRDLEQDVVESNSRQLGRAMEILSADVKAAGYTFFRVDSSQKNTQGYEFLALLVDLRFAHVVQASLSDQHRNGVRYEAYVLALSEYTDVRLKRGLHVLDLDDGKWALRITGQARFKQTLSGNLLRDQLRQSPLIDVDSLTRI